MKNITFQFSLNMSISVENIRFYSQKWDRNYCKNLQYSICNFQKYCKSAIFNSAIFKSIAIAIAIVKTY